MAAADPPPAKLEPFEPPTSFSLVSAAAAVGDADHVASLIAADPKNIALKDSYSCDALSWAARNSFVPVVSLMLEKEADVESKSFGGLRPLHHACQAFTEDIIAELLAKKADPTSKDDAGNTPFHFVCRRCVPREMLRHPMRPLFNVVFPPSPALAHHTRAHTKHIPHSAAACLRCASCCLRQRRM